jgi:hypothetical protein
VRHVPDVAARLGKKLQQPDSIFGLRQTRNIQNLLNDTRRAQGISEPNPRQLHEELDPSPIDQPLCQIGDELLYPFLVLEAKSSTADCDWYSIQLQSAFPIRTFLETQRRLQDAAKSKQAPLVWFFANRGEDWRISVAHMTDAPEALDQKEYVRYHLSFACIALVVADLTVGYHRTLEGLNHDPRRRIATPVNG